MHCGFHMKSRVGSVSACVSLAATPCSLINVAEESVSPRDVSIQAQVINLLLNLQRELQLACLFISYDIAVVDQAGHRIAVMYLGEMVEISPRQAILDNPQHPYTQKLIAAAPWLSSEYKNCVGLQNMQSGLNYINSTSKITSIALYRLGNIAQRFTLDIPSNIVCYNLPTRHRINQGGNVRCNQDVGVLPEFVTVG